MENHLLEALRITTAQVVLGALCDPRTPCHSSPPSVHLFPPVACDLLGAGGGCGLCLICLCVPSAGTMFATRQYSKAIYFLFPIPLFSILQYTPANQVLPNLYLISTYNTRYGRSDGLTDKKK